MSFVSSNGNVELKDSNGNLYRLPVYGPAVTVEILEPKGWPPQVGDIWEAEGVERFIRPRHYPAHTGELWAVPANDQVGRVADELKALNPVLVRRREK